MTIADKIRQSSDEEIAYILWYFENYGNYCKFVDSDDCNVYEHDDCLECPGYLMWLRQDAKRIVWQ